MTDSMPVQHRCLMAWNEPIARPNWTRVRAYSTASESTRAAPPSCSAARYNAARSAVARKGPQYNTAPISSSTTPSSTAVAPLPPWRSGMISPCRPSSAAAWTQTAGS